MRLSPVALGTALALAAPAAHACGGLFCDNVTPVNQAAERILFAPEGDTMHMIVRLTYDGPPIEFGWLLPVPGDVETSVSSETLFTVLDQQYGPRFRLRTVIDPNCEPDFAGGGGQGGAGGEGGMGGGGGGVQVLSREAVGPYDRTILQAASVDSLTEWLDENAYQYPEGAEATLAPYVELGSAFVALKLLPGAESDDVVPLHLTFTSDTPAIPLRPTAVAAEPDMGILVHLLGDHRAVPTNFLHVMPNEAALDWLGGGRNYADVVAQAVDEAGGKAFTTDFSGPTRPIGLNIYSQETLDELAALGDRAVLGPVFELLQAFTGDPDLQRILRSVLILPEGVTADEALRCPFCYLDPERGPVVEVDVAALIPRLEAEYNAPRERITPLFERHDTITRLFTLMSPDEMDEDPVFAFNPDLDVVPNLRIADWHIPCDADGFADRRGGYVQDAAGRRSPVVNGRQAGVIVRQAGQTVRGADVGGAASIQRMFAAGQPETLDELEVPEYPEPDMGGGAGGMGGGAGGMGGGAGGVGGAGGGMAGAGGAGGAGGVTGGDMGMGMPSANASDDGGCSCDAGSGAPPAPLFALALLGLLRRRRR